MKFLKEGIRSTTVRLPTMFVRCTTCPSKAGNVRLLIKALLLKICICLHVSCHYTFATKLCPPMSAPKFVRSDVIITLEMVLQFPTSGHYLFRNRSREQVQDCPLETVKSREPSSGRPSKCKHQEICR